MIDAGKLREQLAAAAHQPPWCVYPPTDRWGGGIGAEATKYNIGGFESDEDDVLAVAAVNALPSLLAVYEAACARRDDRADRLIVTVDAARSDPSDVARLTAERDEARGALREACRHIEADTDPDTEHPTAARLRRQGGL